MSQKSIEKMSNGSNYEYSYSYENSDYQNDGSDFEMTQETIDFLSVTQGRDQNGNPIYYDKNRNQITEEQYNELYERAMNSLDNETRTELETYVNEARSIVEEDNSNRLEIDYEYLEKAITKIRSIGPKVSTLAQNIKSLKAPDFSDAKFELSMAQSEAKDAIGTGDALEADNFLNKELSSLIRLQNQLNNTNIEYDPTADLYDLYNLTQSVNSSNGFYDIQDEAKELSDRIEEGIQRLLKMYSENNRDYDSSFLKETIDQLNDVNKARKQMMQYLEDQAYWEVVQVYSQHLLDETYPISQEQINYYKNNKDKYDEQINKMLDQCEKEWNEAAKYGDFAKYGTVVNKYSLLTDEERYLLSIWSNLNTNIYLNIIKEGEYEKNLENYEALSIELAKYDSSSNNILVFEYAANYMSDKAQDMSDKEAEVRKNYEEAKAICERQAPELEEIKKKIAYYTEIGLDANYVTIVQTPSYKRKEEKKATENALQKALSEGASPDYIRALEARIAIINSQEDFLVQRQQYYCNKYKSNEVNSLKEYQEELEKKNKEIDDKIKEIENYIYDKSSEYTYETDPTKFCNAVNISVEDYDRITREVGFEGLIQYLIDNNKEIIELRDRKKIVEAVIQKKNDSITRFDELLFLDYKKYSNYNDNTNCKIARIETGHCQISDTYIRFYDTGGNIIYPTEEEIALYFAQSGESFPIGQFIYYGDEDGMSTSHPYLNKGKIKHGIKCLNYTYDTDNTLDILNYLDNVHDISVFSSHYQNQVILGAQIKGKQMSEEWLEKWAKDWDVGGFILSLKGFGDGITQYGIGIKNFFGADGIISERDYALMYFTQGLVNKYGGYGEVMKGIYEISNSIGNMTPTLILSTIAYYCPAVFWLDYVSMAGMFASTAGNTIEDGLQRGLTKEEALMLGLMSGSSEVFLEKVLGGILPDSAAKEWAAKHAGVWAAWLLNNMSEVGEEVLQEVLSPCLEYLATGEWNGINWENAAKAGIYAFLTAGIINGGQVAISNGVSVAISGNPNVLNALVLLHKDADPNYNFFSKEFIEELKTFKNSEQAFDDIMGQISKNLYVQKEYDNYVSECNQSGKEYKSYNDFVLMQTANHILDMASNNETVVDIRQEIDNIQAQRDSIKRQIMEIEDEATRTAVEKQVESTLAKLDARAAKLNADYIKFLLEFKVNEKVVKQTTDQIIGGYINEYGEIIRGENATVDQIESEDIEYPDYLEEYKNKVIEGHINNDVWGQAEQKAALDYNMKHKDDFYDLPKTKRDEYINSAYNENVELFKEQAERKKNKYGEIAIQTYETVKSQYENGEFKPGITVDQVMNDIMYQDGANVITYYTDEHNAKWLDNFEPDENGRVTVYFFQDRGTSFVLAAGSYGRPGQYGGLFTTSADVYNEVRAKNYNSETGVWDLDGLSEDLGGVPFRSNDVVVVQMELPATEISMPTSNNQSSYYGEYVPGGYNSAGKVECVVKPFTQDEIPEGYSIILDPGTSREKVIK